MPATWGLDGEAIFVGPYTRREELDSHHGRDLTSSPCLRFWRDSPWRWSRRWRNGRPIVSTAVGGIPELIQDGVNGMLCEPGMRTGWRSSLCRLIDDPDLRERLAQAAAAPMRRARSACEPTPSNFATRSIDRVCAASKSNRLCKGREIIG